MSNNFKPSHSETALFATNHGINSVNFFQNSYRNSLPTNQTLSIPRPMNLTINKNEHTNQYGQYSFTQFNRMDNSQHMPSTNYLNSNIKYSNVKQSNVNTPHQFNQTVTQNFCIRYAVNGLSKFKMGNQVPHENKKIQAGDYGDDAGMIAENSKCIVIGLADGAGGNRNIGIDPQKFSRSLLGFSVEIIKKEGVLPHQLAKLACKSIHALESRHIDGSGTLCLLSLNKHTNMMHALNIGDSGFRLIRQGSIVHKSQATMAGSSPKQLYVSDSSSYSGISFVNEQDIIQDSDIREFPVKKGDLIILASDGMYDVIEDRIIEKIVNSHDERDLQGIADELLTTSMKSYVHTQRDDILIMVCKIEAKKMQ